MKKNSKQQTANGKQQKESIPEKQDQTPSEQIDYQDKYLRALADYQNLVKRAQQEKEDFFNYAHETFVEKLLPVLDNLERAEQNTEDTGIVLVYKELKNILTELGLVRIQIDESDEFDPEIMECIDAEQEGNKLIETRAGYYFKDKIIRPVQVKVVQ